MSILDKKFLLNNYILERYEPKVSQHFFFNAKTKRTWCCPDYIGQVVSALDGKLSIEEIISILVKNNPNTDFDAVKEMFLPVFEFLVKEDFLEECC